MLIQYNDKTEDCFQQKTVFDINWWHFSFFVRAAKNDCSGVRVLHFSSIIATSSWPQRLIAKAVYEKNCFLKLWLTALNIGVCRKVTRNYYFYHNFYIEVITYFGRPFQVYAAEHNLAPPVDHLCLTVLNGKVSAHCPIYNYPLRPLTYLPNFFFFFSCCGDMAGSSLERDRRGERKLIIDKCAINTVLFPSSRKFTKNVAFV